MTYDELITHYGNPAAAAAAIGLDRQVAYGWKVRGGIPLEQQCKYEVESGGKLKADIPPKLRVLIRKPYAAGETGAAKSKRVVTA